MADEYIDGDLPNGSRILTIGSDAFIAEAYEFNEPTGAMLEEKNQNGIPNKQVAKKGFAVGTATLQVPTSSTYAPAWGSTFTTSVRAEASVTMFIVEVGTPEGNEEIKKYPISFRRRINA